MRKLYFSTDTELKSFCERTLAQLLSPATIYFRIGHSALFRKLIESNGKTELNLRHK